MSPLPRLDVSIEGKKSYSTHLLLILALILFELTLVSVLYSLHIALGLLA
jgi:hypothetical protein